MMLRAALAARSLAARSRPLSTAAKSAQLYSERMDKTGRPISPHLMIYRLPAIAWSSVTVRITGFMASAGFFILSGATVACGSEWAVDTAQAISEATSPMLIKFSVAFTLSYQWFGSARHAYWDLTAKGFKNKAMLNGSYAMWAATLIPSLALAFYSLPPLEKKKSK
jgi:succinate dehydrogenase cytochrome b556 subunit